MSLELINGASFKSLALSLFVIFIASRVFKFAKDLKAVNYVPGLRVPFHPQHVFGALIPTVWWNPGIEFLWKWRFHLYKPFKTDTISLVSFLAGLPSIHTSNVDVIRQVLVPGPKSSFGKPEYASGPFARWGTNVFSADGDEWRKHRRIVGPAFNTKLYENVWAQSIVIYREMIAAEGWTDLKVVDVAIVQRLTYNVALLVIMKCGFGFNSDWSVPSQAADGSMSIHESSRVVTANHLIINFAPWLMSIPLPKFQRIRAAKERLMSFFLDEVAQRKEEMGGRVGSTRKSRAIDVFTMLVEANESDNEKSKLTIQELTGNMYIMLFAGHETTAKTLAAAIAYLAIHQDVQQEAYEQIISIAGETADPRFEDYDKLNKVLAIFLEALRLYPPAYMMMRQAYEDTVVMVPKSFGQEGATALPIAKGTWMICNLIGAQSNPRYFDEPEKFKPSRWSKVNSDSDVFTAFSIGQRACIGRKFATVEGVSFLSVLLRDWRVEPMVSDGETIQSWTDRVFQGHAGISLGISDVPVKLSRR
ncbi:cytochrome P450 [Amanita rubescens]|nr:cytochrome P450 [Amanita rubescens]